MRAVTLDSSGQAVRRVTNDRTDVVEFSSHV